MEADDYVAVVKKKKKRRRRGCEFGVPYRHHSAALSTPPSSLQALTSIPHWTSAFLWASIPLQELRKAIRTTCPSLLATPTPYFQHLQHLKFLYKPSLN
jgi:hypothetical protein